MELANDFNIMSSELSVLYRTLENMAFTDELTNMPNRVLFYERLEQATLTASRYNIHCALMMMDLNRFKNINDTLGHHIGDQLLVIVAKRLQTILRGVDTVARLGGDEFAALLPAIENDESASIVAQKIISALDEPIMVNNHSLSIGISIGLVSCPRDGDKTTQAHEEGARPNPVHKWFNRQSQSPIASIQWLAHRDIQISGEARIDDCFRHHHT